MSIEAMKQALEALEYGLDYAKGEQFENAQRFKGYEHLAPDDTHPIQLIEAAITALRQALGDEALDRMAENARELGLDYDQVTLTQTNTGIGERAVEAYEAAKQRGWSGVSDERLMEMPKQQWVGLTDEDLEPLCNEWRIVFGSWTYEFAKAIEAKLKQKNGYVEENT